MYRCPYQSASGWGQRCKQEDDLQLRWHNWSVTVHERCVRSVLAQIISWGEDESWDALESCSKMYFRAHHMPWLGFTQHWAMPLNNDTWYMPSVRNQLHLFLQQSNTTCTHSFIIPRLRVIFIISEALAPLESARSLVRCLLALGASYGSRRVTGNCRPAKAQAGQEDVCHNLRRSKGCVESIIGDC